MQVYDLRATAARRTYVWFMGVLYHLRYPLLGLDIVAQVRRGGPRLPDADAGEEVADLAP